MTSKHFIIALFIMFLWVSGIGQQSGNAEAVLRDRIKALEANLFILKEDYALLDQSHQKLYDKISYIRPSAFSYTTGKTNPWRKDVNR